MKDTHRQKVKLKDDLSVALKNFLKRKYARNFPSAIINLKLIPTISK